MALLSFKDENKADILLTRASASEFQTNFIFAILCWSTMG